MTTAWLPTASSDYRVRQIVGLRCGDVDLRLDAEHLLGLQATEVAEGLKLLSLRPAVSALNAAWTTLRRARSGRDTERRDGVHDQRRADRRV